MKLVSLIDSNYILPAKVLAFSLKKYGKLEGMNWVFLWNDNVNDNLSHYIIRLGFYPEHYLVRDMPKVKDFPAAKPHLKLAKNKLLFWALPEDEYLSLDLDMVCLKSARDIFGFKPFSAMARPGADGFCSGLMVLRPSEETFGHLMNEAGNPLYQVADQDVLNWYYKRFHNLPWKWNTSHREETRQKNGLTLIQDAVFLHFHGANKPWNTKDGISEISYAIYQHILKDSGAS